MPPVRVIVLSASSDIGAHLCASFARQGADVLGTYRQDSPALAGLRAIGVRLHRLDVTSASDVARFVDDVRASAFSWNVFVSAVGLLEPIGSFFELDFDVWQRSIMVNSTAQLRVLHALFPLRDVSTTGKAVFFAGGGTNGAFDNYSAYCLGKLLLVKMVELLHSECPQLQATIIGTGWVATKIHRQTLAAGQCAGANLQRTRQFLDGELSAGATMDDVAACVHWCLSAPRAAVGGRNIALAHDPWRDERLVAQLEADPERYKLRRRS